MRSIGEHAAAGDEVRRVFVEKSWNRERLAIAFVRSPGSDPIVSVHFPRTSEGPPLAPLSAPVTAEAWREVVARSGAFHLDYAKPAEPPDVICLDGLAYHVEASDGGAEARDRTVRTKRAHDCERSPALAYTGELERLALNLLAPCRALDVEQHLGRLGTLEACGTLSGDRLAAAAALNRAAPFRKAKHERDAGLLAGRFHFDGTVDWMGTRSGKGPAALAFWIARMSEAGGPILFIEAVHGEDARRVRMKGKLTRWVETGEGSKRSHEAASVEFIWAAQSGTGFQVQSVTIGLWSRES